MKNLNLQQLNPAQHQAVTAPNKNILVLAGAGSGKTGVLVQRIAWLIREQQVSPLSILAVTFTNKAANEMKKRIESALGISAKNMWIGTFHGIAHRLLRIHHEALNLPDNFQILDVDDSLRLIKKIQKELSIDDTHFVPKETMYFINKSKENGLRAKNINAIDNNERVLQRIYHMYEEHCFNNGLVDFTELLLRAKELWKDNADIRTKYQERFRHVLIDEFQDTNKLQYSWLKLLATKNNHFMVVGDDDQSIYGWRGACIENIHKFTTEFDDCEVIRLEQNYRSTKLILDAANALIKKNPERMGKDLWTEHASGDKIALYHAYNEIDEARYVADIIKKYKDRRLPLREIAILYRSNAQSRVFEEELILRGVPYRIYGGLRFFERAEIKDALAYLRLITNHHDNAAFERIVNWPTRGIGEKSLSVVRNLARENNISLWQATQQIFDLKLLTPRAITGLKTFHDLILNLKKMIENVDLDKKIELVTKHSGLIAQYQKEKGERGQSRIENLQELVTASNQFDSSQYPDIEPLTAFLAHAVLEAGEAQAPEFEDYVNLMTLHSAKGLEFDCVFLVGMEEGLFPHRMALYDDFRQEEERRLCYVGITRAKRNLHMSFAEYRRLYGREEYNMPSRFLREVPQELFYSVREEANVY